jgi:hypothetical protein
MIHGRSVLSLTATAAEMWQFKASLTAYIATVLQTGKKKFMPAHSSRNTRHSMHSNNHN